ALNVSCSKKAALENPIEGSWEDIENAATGTTVNFYMWGGDTRINKWVDEYAAPRLKEEYNMKLNRVSMNAEDFVNKLISEKSAAKENGSIDLLWINGENFYTTKENGLLYGPFAEKLPNYQKYIKQDAPENQLDFGYPIEGYEVPYGRAQMVFVYDSEKTPVPPKNFAELESFIKNNPGKFTYPAPPDFTGSAFIRNMMYMTTGGYDQYMNIEPEAVQGKASGLWSFLNEIKPYLWREGTTYPATIGQLDTMFADGEVLMSMTYMPIKPSGDILKGLYPKGTKTFVLEEGTISNTHFLAIPQNASNKAGAMAAANMLMSFDAQLSKLDPNNWGDLPVFDTTKLSTEEKAALAALDLGSATLSQEEMGKYRSPEIPAKLIPVIEALWTEFIVKE
ncbi:MAG: ABC-type uncharacterized transport system, periplasmic component, partial [Clostridia bacterium]|nr:ABC-type uncharacterized transport system, periplasmic component [Clostridia bacterium]